MMFEDVETFLEVVGSGSVGRAAENLYIGQGTASQRLRRLEHELGITLLWRHPGMRKVTLTPEGEYFYTIARQWITLQQQAEGIRNLNINKQLRIAATEMYNRYHFADIYPAFLKTHPDVSLFLQTEHSTEIHQLIEQQQIDFGFVGTLHKSPSIRSIPFFKEKFTVLCHKENPYCESHSMDDLDPNQEIYSIWSSEYELWHQRNFHVDTHKITIGTVSMIENFLITEHTWTIVTEYIAKILCQQNKHLTSIPFQDHVIPDRITYLIYYRYSKPWIQDLIDEFINETTAMLQKTKLVEMLATDLFVR